MNNNPNKLIPQLRFPEYVNEGEWTYLNGNELFEPISNKNHNSDLPILAITQEQGAIPRKMIDYHVSVTDKSIESYKVVEIGDFIISLRSFQGGIEYSDYHGLCSPAYIILRKKIDLENAFYRHYFKSANFISRLATAVIGIRDGKQVNFQDFGFVKLPYPDIEIQNRIGTILDTCDKELRLLRAQRAAINQQKRGLMQKLLTGKVRVGDEEGKKTRTNNDKQ